jgi:hypothetical protein
MLPTGENIATILEPGNAALRRRSRAHLVLQINLLTEHEVT